MAPETPPAVFPEDDGFDSPPALPVVPRAGLLRGHGDKTEPRGRPHGFFSPPLAHRSITAGAYAEPAIQDRRTPRIQTMDDAAAGGKDSAHAGFHCRMSLDLTRQDAAPSPAAPADGPWASRSPRLGRSPLTRGASEKWHEERPPRPQTSSSSSSSSSSRRQLKPSSSWMDERPKASAWQKAKKLLIPLSGSGARKGPSRLMGSIIPHSEGSLSAFESPHKGSHKEVASLSLFPDPCLEEAEGECTPTRRPLFCKSSQKFMESVSSSEW